MVDFGLIFGRLLTQKRAVWIRAERERADVRRSANEVAACVERLCRETEREEVARTRGAAQCIERMVRNLERRETALLARCDFQKVTFC